ncbi:unnamed protein product [Rotaria socialis]|uniref:G-protein coupled receptors family 1 profile domain-containing protein n=1 Tax=Rotaria socialis TaxID=392032 RepID=A0A818B347_9BILA|nr:unnamed protein product [Rotaria socialis]
MNIPSYNTEIVNDVLSNLANIVQGNNDSLVSPYDYLYDNTENNMNNNIPYPGGIDQLSTIFQQLFSKISGNQTTYNTPSSSGSLSPLSRMVFPLSISVVSSLPSSLNDANSYRLLSITSLWFVLIVNPISILVGLIGNLLTIYILMNSNIIKLPVSFYAIMLNISDTLNLLIPVFIFWLDNCINRTPERGYFRDKSNFLCKALMCPDQLFAALSAWYMCAISFNRWYSICHPSSFFFNMSSHLSKRLSQSKKNHIKQIDRGQKNIQSQSSMASFCSALDFCYCFTGNIKNRQNLRAFRSITIITLLGILCCLYPIFMHELRPVISTNQHGFDLKQKRTHTYAIVWKRCFYSQRHEHVYDIIGITLSCFLHILPLTFVAAMNIMIIAKLRERRNMMPISTNTAQSSTSNNKNKTLLDYSPKLIPYTTNISLSRKNGRVLKTEIDSLKSSSQLSRTKTHKDQSTLTDAPPLQVQLKQSQVIVKIKSTAQRRHYSRDRTITMMLVSVALTYIILTIPYRLFWSYNVYTKRMHPEKLNSSVYLLKMHYIDHVLRTIRNMHYGTNFIFFILFSKSFRQKFQQLFIENFLPRSKRSFNRNMDTCSDTHCNNLETNKLQRNSIQLEEKPEKNPEEIIIHRKKLLRKKYSTQNIYQKSLNPTGDASKEPSNRYPTAQCDGNAVTQSAYPNGLFVDALGTLYVAESKNDRVMRWVQGAKQGTLIVGGNGRGAGANQLNSPLGLSFDRHGNLYVAEYGNNRVQRFSIA